MGGFTDHVAHYPRCTSIRKFHIFQFILRYVQFNKKSAVNLNLILVSLLSGLYFKQCEKGVVQSAVHIRMYALG